MNIQSWMLHDAEPKPPMTPEALMVREVAIKMKTVSKDLGWKTESPVEEFNHVYLKAQMSAYPSSYVSLSYGRYPHDGRITVSARTNHDESIYDYGEKHLSISVGATRSADQILKEIQRRFLPSFLEIARKSEEIQKQHTEYRQRLEFCLGRLKGEPLEESEKNKAKVHLQLDEMWGTVQYDGDDQVALELRNVPVEKAGRILAIFREKTGSPMEDSHVS